MNASALLTKQGWLGQGHALDRAGRGAKKPILISKKSDNLGVGKKKVDVHADQWWARAFDEGLKGLNPGSNSTVKAASQTPAPAKVSELDLLANGGKKWLGLYSGFVRGEGLEGTIGREVVHGIAGDASAQDEGSREQKKVRKVKKKRKDREDNGEVLSLATSNAGVEDKESRERKKHKKKRRKTHAESDGQLVLEKTAIHEIEITSSAVIHGKNKDTNEGEYSKVSSTIQSTPDRQLKEKKKRKHKKSSSSAG